MKFALARTSKIKSIVNIYACNFGERFPADESRSRFFFCFLVRAIVLALSKPLSPCLHKDIFHVKVVLLASNPARYAKIGPSDPP